MSPSPHLSHYAGAPDLLVTWSPNLCHYDQTPGTLSLALHCCHTVRRAQSGVFRLMWSPRLPENWADHSQSCIHSRPIRAWYPVTWSLSTNQSCCRPQCTVAQLWLNQCTLVRSVDQTSLPVTGSSHLVSWCISMMLLLCLDCFILPNIGFHRLTVPRCSNCNVWKYAGG